MSIYLITTAEEKSWPDEGKVLFLNGWCKRQDREKQWLKFDSTTVAPYVLTPEKEKNYVDRLFKILLHELSDELNKFHQTSYSKRYWSILVGPWLRIYTKAIINRYNTIELAINTYSFDKTIVLNYPDDSLPVLTFSQFVKRLNFDDLWNHAIFTNMLKHWPRLDIDFVQKIIKHNNDFNESKKIKIGRRKKIRKLVFLTSRLLCFFKRRTDAVVINSYLPRLQEAALQLYLGQMPQLWSTPEVNQVDASERLRNNFFQNYESFQGVECEIRRLIHVLIPICYLEGYKSLENQSSKVPWPSDPKFIYTANNFNTDELFKLWVAQKSETATPYYIGQHGNNYGTLSTSQTATEITTCDKFISWGWCGVYANTNVSPAFIFKTAGRSHVNVDKQGGLLLVGAPPGQVGSCVDKYSKYITYQQNILSFLDILGSSIKAKTTIRLFQNTQKKGFMDAYIFKSHHPDISIMDYDSIGIEKVIPKNRISVYLYDSTGVLECLSLNIPVICFWHGGLEKYFVDAIPYYELLIDSGIVHTNPESAAKHIIKYWDDVDAWWESKIVQNAREVFCDKYARKVDKPVRKLKDLLLSDL